MELLFLTPEGKTRKASLSMWGPGGRNFSPSEVTLPEGVEWAAGATSGWIDAPWCKKLGYLRITGGMNADTAQAFHAAFNKLKGVEAMILDCRSMGGGGDGPAWEMAGRFYPKGVDNGINGRIEASGPWQFDGPVVMLQGESEVSSAETFTWAMTEPERVVSVGRFTGGWTIIPRVFKCPSGLVDFRMGVSNRPSPIKGIRSEGVGWPPDVHVPYGPVLCAEPDPVRDVGMQVLQVLHAGVSRKKTVAAFQDLFSGKIDAFRKQAPKLSKALKDWKPERLAKKVEEDLKARLEMESALLNLEDCEVPDALGATRRLEMLTPLAKAAGMKGPLGRMAKAVKGFKTEAQAQEALLEMRDPFGEADEADRKAYLKKYGKTRTGRFLAEHVWK